MTWPCRPDAIISMWKRGGGAAVSWMSGRCSGVQRSKGSKWSGKSGPSPLAKIQHGLIYLPCLQGVRPNGRKNLILFKNCETW